MATKKTKTDTLVQEAFDEVMHTPPSTLKKGQSAPARHKQEVAIALSKARAKGADVPPPPKKRGARSTY
jgi:hypothetical protein